MISLRNKPQIMPQPNHHSKFLSRNDSKAFFFSCCAKDTVSDAEIVWPTPKAEEPKISIKKVMKKSTIRAGDKSMASDKHSRPHSKKSLQTNTRKRNHARTTSINYSDMSSMQKSEQRSLHSKPKSERRINFIYNNEANSSQKVVHNYHTTNFIVEKYIVQPQQMNIFMKTEQTEAKNRQKQEQQKPQYYYKNFDLRSSYAEEEIMEVSPKWPQQSSDGVTLEPIKTQSPKRADLPMQHFSFGEHQRANFMKRYLDSHVIREVESRKQSSVQSQRQSLAQFEANKQEGLQSVLLPSNFIKNGLNSIVRNAKEVEDELGSSQNSRNSQVIDTYQSFMSRLRQKGVGPY